MRILLASTAVAAVVLFTTWFFEMPLEKAILVAPISVLAFGAAVGLVVLWAKVVTESLRAGAASRRSRAQAPEPGSRTPSAS